MSVANFLLHLTLHLAKVSDRRYKAGARERSPFPAAALLLFAEFVQLARHCLHLRLQFLHPAVPFLHALPMLQKSRSAHAWPGLPHPGTFTFRASASCPRLLFNALRNFAHSGFPQVHDGFPDVVRSIRRAWSGAGEFLLARLCILAEIAPLCAFTPLFLRLLPPLLRSGFAAGIARILTPRFKLFLSRLILFARLPPQILCVLVTSLSFSLPRLVQQFRDHRSMLLGKGASGEAERSGNE